MAKVIIRSEVNALVEGTFETDLTKAVLYGELSGNTNFVVNPVNSVSLLNYTENQALLEADIRVSASITVTLTPRQSIIESTGTSVIFDITTAGTASVGAPEYSIVTATYDGGNPTSAVINGTELTITFPANADYSPKEIDAKVKLTIDGNEFNSNLATAHQNAAGYLRFNPDSNTIHSTGTTDTAHYETNCTNIEVLSSVGVTSTVIDTATDTVSIAFPMNTASTQTMRTVTIQGTTPDNTTITATYTITHEAALPTGLQFSYDGGNVSAASGSIPASEFTIVLTNAVFAGASADNGMSVTTGGTVDAPTITVTYPANTSTTDQKNYIITVTAVDIYGRPISAHDTVTQNDDAHTLGIQPDSASVQYHQTALGFDVTNVNMSNVGFCPEASSPEISGAVSENRATASFPQNTGNSAITYTFAITGTSIAGAVETAIATFTQTAAASANIQITFDNDPVNASVTNNTFVVVTNGIDNSTLGWNQAGTSGITACTVDRTNLTGNTWFAANSQYVDRTLTLSITGTSLLGETITGTAHFEQTKVIVTPQLSITYTGQTVGSASGSTSAFTIVSNYVTVNNYSVTSPATVGASGATSVTINYPANTGNPRQFTVTVSGVDVYGNPMTSSCPFTQSADSYVFEIEATMSHVAATSTTVEFNIISSGVNNIGYYSPDSSNVTDCTISGNIAIAEFTQNESAGDRRIELCLSGTTAGGETVYAYDWIYQLGAVIFKITYTGGTVSSGAGSTNEFSIEVQNATVEYFYVDGGATISASGATSVTVAYPINEGSGTKNYEVRMEGSDNNSQRVVSTTQIPQNAEYRPGDLKVEAAGDGDVCPESGYEFFNVYWTGFTVGSTISLSGSAGMSNIYPSSINVNATDGQQEIVFDYSSYSGNDSRYLTLTASGTDSHGLFHSDSGFYIQHGPGELDLTVSANSPTVPATATTASFTVSCEEIYGEVTFSSPIGSVSPTSFWPEGTDSRTVTVTMGANTGSSTRTITLTASSSCGDLSDSDDVTQEAGTTPVNPDIWWTKTSEGPSSTEVTEIHDVPAYGDGDYDGSDVEYTIYINYNSDVDTVTFEDSGLLLDATATINGKTVTITAPINKNLSSRSLGALVITGTAADGTTSVSATLSITQEAGVSCSLLIEGSNNYLDPINISANGGDSTYDYTYLNVDPNSIGEDTSERVTATGTSIDSGNLELTVNFEANQTYSDKVWSITITGTTVFGDTISAIVHGEQDGQSAPVNPDIWWTETYEGSVATEVSSVNDVPAYVPYSSSDVEYVIYINYNSDVDTVTLDDSGLLLGATASMNGKTITITAPANTGLSLRSLGVLVITGTAPDGQTSDSEPLSITQEAGVSCSLLIENVADYVDGTPVPASGGSRAYPYSYNNVSNIDVSYYDVPSSASISGNFLRASFPENESITRSWTVEITGTTIYGDTITATVSGTQDHPVSRSVKFTVVNGEFQNNSRIDNRPMTITSMTCTCDDDISGVVNRNWIAAYTNADGLNDGDSALYPDTKDWEIISGLNNMQFWCDVPFTVSRVGFTITFSNISGQGTGPSVGTSYTIYVVLDETDTEATVELPTIDWRNV